MTLYTNLKNPLLDSSFWNVFRGGEPVVDSTSTYPKYNITYFPNSKRYMIEVGVTGFSSEDLSVSFDPKSRSLFVSARKKHMDNYEEFVQVKRTLGTRAFDISFRIDQNLEIDQDSIEVKDGILFIVCKENVPKEEQPIVFSVK